jgi:putative sigma-54 modulation protein
MDIQKLSHRVDIIMKVGDTTIKSHAETTDMYASIDMAVHKIEAQLRRYKTRLEDHHAKGVPAIDMVVNVIEPYRTGEVVEINEMIEEENRRKMEDSLLPHKVISQEKYSIKRLNQEEAIMKMELSLAPFLIFLGEEDQKLKVIYRREDDNFGIVEVEE